MDENSDIYELKLDVLNVIVQANKLVLNSKLLLEDMKHMKYYDILIIRKYVDMYEDKLNDFENRLWHSVNINDVEDPIRNYGLDNLNEADLKHIETVHQGICIGCSNLLEDMKLYYKKYFTENVT
ncbi:MAG: hypothetical protein QG646_3006 [Euryarchaeota archaeon]|nr:hypothetical protein [Euryarchaeota archaeon]